MSWFWSLLIYFLGVFIGGAVWNHIAYRRGVRDGRINAMIREVTREDNYAQTGQTAQAAQDK